VSLHQACFNVLPFSLYGNDHPLIVIMDAWESN
jgi:hypothetical protein